MKVQVRYFASLREALGAAESVDVPEGSTLHGLRELLLPAQPAACRALLARESRGALRARSAPVRRGHVAGRGGRGGLLSAGDRGLNMAARVSIRHADFDLSAEVAALRADDGGVGAVAVFVGTVREHSGGQAVQRMELEHYPGMTEAAIEAMIDAAMARFDIRAARVVHRVGVLEPLDQIVLVAVSSAHRGQAFQACEFLMDYLKTQAPFWKKEGTAETGALGRCARQRRCGARALGRRCPTTPDEHGLRPGSRCWRWRWARRSARCCAGLRRCG